MMLSVGTSTLVSREGTEAILQLVIVVASQTADYQIPVPASFGRAAQPRIRFPQESRLFGSLRTLSISMFSFLPASHTGQQLRNT
jgi:hypothetical protein